MTRFRHKHEAATGAEAPLISSVSVVRMPMFDLVTVWNRGGRVGELRMPLGAGDKLAELLLPLDQRAPAK